jgi:hypothetical protein
MRKSVAAITVSMILLKRGIQELFEGTVDAHSPGHLLITGELQSKIDWVVVGNVVGVYVCYLPDQKVVDLPYAPAERVKALKAGGYKIGALTSNPLIGAYKSAGIEVYETQTDDSLMQMLRGKRFNFANTDIYAAVLSIARTFPKETGQFGVISVSSAEASVAFSKANPKSAGLKAKFEAGLAAIEKNGTYIKIFEKYFGKGNIPAEALPPNLKSFASPGFDMNKIPR